MGTKKISQFDWPSRDTSCHGKQIQYTRGSLLLKQTSATDLPLELAPSYIDGKTGGAVASWLVSSSPDRAVRVRALAGGIVLCS